MEGGAGHREKKEREKEKHFQVSEIKAETDHYFLACVFSSLRVPRARTQIAPHSAKRMQSLEATLKRTAPVDDDDDNNNNNNNNNTATTKIHKKRKNDDDDDDDDDEEYFIPSFLRCLINY